MKALVLKQIKTPLDFEEREDLKPSSGEVVVQLRAASLNRRDFWITQGLYPGIEPPVILGSDGAGVVTKCGDSVDPAWQDRDVIINPGLDWGASESAQTDEFNILGLPRDGTFATEVNVPASQLHAKPSDLDWNQAAAIPLAGMTAYRAIFSQGNLEAGQTVLITGIGGGVATFALQFAVAAGAKVWVTSSSPEKLEHAKRLGARDGFNYTDPDWFKAMSAEAVAPNLIIDSAGGPGYKALINLAAPGGRIVNYGATAGMPEKFDLFKVFWKQLHIVGTTMGSPKDFAEMIEFVEKHRITPVIDDVFALADGNQAVERMQSSPQFGKYVLTIA